jgi:hypothetical protein
MYRFLDKRFHQSDTLELDLLDFACGHIGLAETRNVAILKQRLAPAIAELEGLGFIEPAEPATRYKKIRPGVWRIGFERKHSAAAVTQAAKPPLPPQKSSPSQLVTEFYRLWQGSAAHEPNPGELRQAQQIAKQYGLTEALNLLPQVVTQLKTSWPEAKTFAAVTRYIGEVAGEQRRHKRHEDRQRAQLIQQREERQQAAAQLAQQHEFKILWQPRWDRLSPAEQEAIRMRLVSENPWLKNLPHELQFRCLKELAKQLRDDAHNG